MTITTIKTYLLKLVRFYSSVSERRSKKQDLKSKVLAMHIDETTALRQRNLKSMYGSGHSRFEAYIHDNINAHRLLQGCWVANSAKHQYTFDDIISDLCTMPTVSFFQFMFFRDCFSGTSSREWRV